jgi:hypothetical protein
MRTINLLSVEVLSNRELAAVKGGGEEGIPTPIIIVEEGISAPTVQTLSVLTVAAPVTTTVRKRK